LEGSGLKGNFSFNDSFILFEKQQQYALANNSKTGQQGARVQLWLSSS